MTVGDLFHSAIAQLVDCSEQIAEWETAVAEISARANAWLTFTTVCAAIGFALSVVALAMLIFERRKGNVNSGNEL